MNRYCQWLYGDWAGSVSASLLAMMVVFEIADMLRSVCVNHSLSKLLGFLSLDTCFLDSLFDSI